MAFTQTEEMEYLLIDMMFDSKPIEEFEKLWKDRTCDAGWSELLHMSYCEQSYISVGGDEGHLENPTIDHKRLAYLEKLIAFLEGKGIKEAK